jgi:uncharacterized protein (DUF2164 family)
MAIDLPAEAKQALVDEIKHYFRTERDEEIGDLQAGFLLDFVLETIGPSIYNQAVRDAQAKLQTAVADLDVTLYRPEAGAGRR